jgi:CheY-like chemotaxis protein
MSYIQRNIIRVPSGIVLVINSLWEVAMGLLQRWMEQLQAGALARRMQRAGHIGFFDYRFAADRFTWTPSLCTLFGLGAPPHGGVKQWYARMKEADRMRVERELWTACALRRRRETLDYAIILPDGRSRSLSSHIILRYGPDGRALRMTGVTVDVALHDGDPATSPRDELAAMLSHQLRTPLGALSMANDVLQAVPPGSDDAREALAVIGRQTARLAQLVHEFAAAGREEPATEPPAQSEPPPSPRRKILVVENNSDALASLRTRLELDGHEVATAGDGLEGLCRLRELKPEISIVDIGLPSLTGFDLARRARASGYSGRMIALTGPNNARHAGEARLAGFDDWLIKPVEPHELRASLRED